MDILLYGSVQRNSAWIGKHPMQPKTRNMGDGTFPKFLDKGEYLEPQNVAAAMLRPLEEPDVPFKLHIQGLKPEDLNL